MELYCEQKKKSKALQPNMSARRKGNHNNEGAGSSSNYDSQNKIKKTSGATNVGISAHGSPDIAWTDAGGGEGKKPKGVGHEIFGNEIKGDGAPKVFYNFSNTNKTTDDEDDGTPSNIHDNSITALNRAECVGISDFHNVNLMSNASQDQCGREGKEDFPNFNPSAIHDNIIYAEESTKVGLHDFNNTKYYKTTSTKDHVKADGGGSIPKGRRSSDHHRLGKKKNTKMNQS